MEQVLSTIWNLCTTATNDSTTATSDATTNSSSAQAQYAISQGMLPLEQSYIENILRLNKGKQATVVMTYERGSSLVHNLIQVLLKRLAVTILLLVNRNQENAIYY